MNTLRIATACVLNPEGQLLLVRKRGSRFWMLPGGKIDGTETALQALLRELQEELQWQAADTPWQSLGHFENRAANEANTQVQAQVFYTQHRPSLQLQIAAEIEAMQWWPLDGSMDDSFAPLLCEMVVPALLAALQRPQASSKLGSPEK